MSNTLPSSKTKLTPRRAPSSVSESRAQYGPGKREGAENSRKHAPKAMEEEAAQQLRAGTDLLTEAVSKFAITTRASGAAFQPGGFRQAYASIVQFLPKGRRLAVLEAMRQGIDELIREEAQAAKPSISTADFMAKLEQQELAQRERDAEEGALLLGIEMQERLQVSAQALSAALKRKRIFALKGASGKYLYPAFFADPAYDRAVLERVCQVLGDLPGSSKLQFFTSPRLSLRGKTPLQALARGQIDAVLDLANAAREA